MGTKGLVAWTVLVAAAAATAGFWVGRQNQDAPELPERAKPVQPIAPVAPVKTAHPESSVEGTAVDDPSSSDETILRVRCVIPDGAPATDVGAWFSADRDDPNRNYPASITGSIVTVHAPFGRGQLSILVEGCVVERMQVEAPDGQTTDVGPIELRRAVPLRGRVVDADGAPVTNAFVYPKVGDHSVALTGSRDDGWFEFDGLPSGEATLRVECKTMVRRIVTFDHAADLDPIEIVLEKGELLRGRVFDENGEPIDTVYASVVDTAAPEDRGRMAFPHLNDDGTFDVRLLPGRYIVRTRNDGRNASETVDIIEGREAVVTLRFAAR